MRWMSEESAVARSLPLWLPHIHTSPVPSVWRYPSGRRLKVLSSGCVDEEQQHPVLSWCGPVVSDNLHLKNTSSNTPSVHWQFPFRQRKTWDTVVTCSSNGHSSAKIYPDHLAENVAHLFEEFGKNVWPSSLHLVNVVIIGTHHHTWTRQLFNAWNFLPLLPGYNICINPGMSNLQTTTLGYRIIDPSVIVGLYTTDPWYQWSSGSLFLSVWDGSHCC